jgi:FAD/FMN-containing dehydrogenase
LAIGSQGSCQIGGNIATNAGGLTVMRYGTIRDLLLGLEVVLPDGRIMNTLRALRKVSAGYDLKHLFVSSEGTLGIVTGAVLKLFPKPRTVATAWVALRSLEAAVDLLARLRADFQERVCSYEVISRGQLDLVYKHCEGTRDPVGSGYPWAALLELTDAQAETDLVEQLQKTLSDALDADIALDVVLAMSAAQRERLWYLREGLSIANVAEGRHVSHDTSVPISALPEFVRRANADVMRAFPDAHPIASGHVGDGNIHVGYMFPRSRFPTPESYETAARAINEIVFAVTRDLHGGFCAEHGIGIAYREPLARFADGVELDVMRSIKSVLDPKGIMNPGKVFQ